MEDHALDVIRFPTVSTESVVRCRAHEMTCETVAHRHRKWGVQVLWTVFTVVMWNYGIVHTGRLVRHGTITSNYLHAYIGNSIAVYQLT